jgi:hypothetical protein
MSNVRKFQLTKRCPTCMSAQLAQKDISSREEMGRVRGDSRALLVCQKIVGKEHPSFLSSLPPWPVMLLLVRLLFRRAGLYQASMIVLACPLVPRQLDAGCGGKQWNGRRLGRIEDAEYFRMRCKVDRTEGSREWSVLLSHLYWTCWAVRGGESAGRSRRSERMFCAFCVLPSPAWPPDPKRTIALPTRSNGLTLRWPLRDSRVMTRETPHAPTRLAVRLGLPAS